MLPAFPLDGGRVVRALVWLHTHDLPRATGWAAAAGRAFAIAMVAGGVLLASSPATSEVCGLPCLASSCCRPPRRSCSWSTPRRRLGGLRVADIMVRDPISVPADLPLDRFFDDVFLAHRHTAYPVVDDGPVGLVSFRDALDVPRDQWPHLRVGDRMLPLEQALVIDADRDLADVVDDLMQDRTHRAGPPRR